ncbi:hypothetical protein CIHG_09310 [Coccidioides immitis H538.4]|uniref:Uncharacterized protein n=1 Tax=Coccidioides immitis H538.4 TaxID=396776 RepID=A0A0J8S3M8_COCIT|nr:hypothetical protein CIHG_09310 [Coccidioides immitis H538.4]
MVLSLPNLGPYLRLVSAARSQMLSLLEKSKYKEAPLSLLRDRWDGAVESQAPYAVAKRARGESSGVLPGRTKKWKELYGMNFRWALEEAIGAGLIEIFDTGCVGPGVRRLVLSSSSKLQPSKCFSQLHKHNRSHGSDMPFPPADAHWSILLLNALPCCYTWVTPSKPAAISNYSLLH